MIKVENLPNFCNGKLYKRWTKVSPMYGDGSILASKTNSHGGTTQLLLTEKGAKKELICDDGKIVDITDNKGNKRVYSYKRIDENTIKGQMIASADENGKFPLITGAKWILKNMIPEKLYLQINTKHTQSNIYIPKEGPDGTPVYTGKIDQIQVKEILAKNFDKNIVFSLPKTILFKTTQGETKAIIKENAEENRDIIRHFGIESEVLGKNLRTIV